MFYLILVNYNNASFSKEYVKSALSLTSDCSIHIVDNNSKYEERVELENWEKPIQVTIHFLNDNIGYFPALNYAYQIIKKQLTLKDIVVIGNNDLVFDKKFFSILKHKLYNKDVFVVCPDIINIGGNHQNPAIITKYSKSQLLFLDLYHSCYFMALLINGVSSIFKFRGKQKSKPEHDKSQYISIGYGACFILTSEYFTRIDEIPSYLFLMNEENSLSDIVFKNGGRLFYDCELKVNHMEHSSVTKIPSKNRFKIEQHSYRISKQHFDNSKLYDKELVKE